MIEFDGPALTLHAPGTNPLTIGSSGTFSKNESSFSLKTLMSHFVRFLMLEGRALNSAGPFTYKVCSLIVCTAFLE